MRRKRLRRLRRLFGLYLPLAAFLFFALFPFYWMALSSFKANSELYNLHANRLWITHFTLDHYRHLFENTVILHWLWNSFFVSFLTSFISMAFGVMAGYALARLKFPGAQAFGLATFVTYLVPTTLIFIPLASVVQWLGLSNSIWALVATYPTFLIPFCTWMLIAYFKSIPKDMEECAMIDGCPPHGHPGRHLLRHVQLHPLLERVRLRPHLHLQHHPEDHVGRRPHGAHPGGRLLLGRAHGGLAPRLRAGGRPLLLLHGVLRLRAHRRRPEGLTGAPKGGIRMQYFVSQTTPRAILVMFDRDDLLLEGLQEVVKQERIDTAAITGGIGSLQRVHLHTITTTGLPPADKFWNFTGPIEMGSLQGSVIGGDVHAHMSVFDWDSKQTYIGHLEPGSIVAYRAEVSLVVLEGVQTERYNDAQGNFLIRQKK
jgi:predicted DNA-binding protein with PD1-like motif/ABC-type sugar transport system permease subunit